MWRAPRTALGAIALLTAIACGGGDDNGSGPVGSITISASPASLALDPGGTGTVTVTLTRGGGFADPVNVTVEGLPAGVTATVQPAQLTGQTTQATVTVNVASTVAAGTYPATIRASATGIGAATAQYTLTVNALPSYTMSITPTTLTVAPGGNGQTTVNLTRTNFTAAVTLSLSAPPAGITATFNPAAPTGNTSTATISVASTVAPGNYNVTIRGVATGQADKTATLAVTVSTAADFTISANPTTVTAAPGGSGNTNVSIVRSNHTADVALTLVNPPAGITGTFNPATLTGATLQSALTINVGAGVAAGSYNVTVQGAGGGVTKTTTVAVTVAAGADFTISANPTSVQAAPGGSGNTNVSIVRTNHTADVALTLVNPPAGITGTFNPATLTGANLTSVLTINVGAGVAAGSYNVTVQGAGGGVTKTTTVAVTVAAAADFTISANPTSVQAAPGGSVNTNVSIVRTNHTAAVALTLVTPPAGITGTFNPASLTGATLTSVLTINVGAGVAAGSYNLTVQGAGGGVTKTTTVGVTVTGGGGGGNLVWDFCNTDPLPLRFWRLSSGTWAEVPPTTVGNVTRYSFTIASASGGVAFTTTVSAAARQRVYNRLARGQWQKAIETARSAQASLKDGAITVPYPETFTIYGQSNELTGFAETCPTAPVTVAKTFNVSGQGGTEAGLLGYGPATASLQAATTTYNLNVPAGSYDYMAIFGPAPSFPDLSQNWSNYRIGRNEAAPGAAVAIARAGATAFAQFPFTVTGGVANSFYQFTQFIEGSRGDIIGFGIGSILNTTGTGTALFLATADRLGTDMNSLFISNTEQVGANGAAFRSSILYLGSAPPATSSYALPQAVPAFTVTGSAASWTVAGSTPTDYQTTSSTLAASITGAAAVQIVTATRAWLQANNQATTYSLVTPVLPNFNAAWAAATPLEDASVIMIGGNVTTTPVAGSRINTAMRLQSPP